MTSSLTRKMSIVERPKLFSIQRDLEHVILPAQSEVMTLEVVSRPDLIILSVAMETAVASNDATRFRKNEYRFHKAHEITFRLMYDSAGVNGGATQPRRTGPLPPV